MKAFRLIALVLVLATVATAARSGEWESLNQQVFELHEQGRYAEAIIAAEAALRTAEREFGKEHLSTASSLNNLAELYRAQGRYAEAEPLYKRSLSIDEKALGPENSVVALSLNNLAVLYTNQARYAEAEPLYKRSLSINEKTLGPEHSDVARSLNNLAALYDYANRHAEAEPLYKRSLSIWETALGPEHPDVAASLNSLAVLYSNQSRYAEAEPLFKRSLSIREKALGPEHPHVALSLNNLAYLRQALADTHGAIVLFERALNTLRTTRPKWDRTAATLRPLPFSIDVLHSLSIAEASSYAPVDRLETGPARREALGRALDAARIGLDLLARMRATMSKEDREHHEQAFSALPVWLLKLQKELESVGVPPDRNLTLRAAEMASAWAFLEMMAETRSDASGALPSALASEERELLTRIEWLGKRAGEPAADAELPEAEKKLDAFIERLHREQPRYAALKYPRPATLQSARASLQPDEAAISYLVGAHGGYLVAVTRDSFAFEKIGEHDELRDLIAAVRTSLGQAADRGGKRGSAPLTVKVVLSEIQRGAPSDADVDADVSAPPTHDETLRRLFDSLIAPVAELIKDKSLIIVPSAELEGIAFESLVTPSGGYLVDEHEISYAPSLAILSLLREWKQTDPVRTARLLALGDPVYDAGTPDAAARTRAAVYSDTVRAGWAPLPGTGVEVRIISNYFPDDEQVVLLGSDATEDRVTRRSWREFGYLHFATHGALEEGPGRQPALVLSQIGNTPPADGFLTISEVVARPHRARLTVLSACNSGRSIRELPKTGVASLARAFLLTGSDAVIVSLWPVSDEATAYLMALMYKGMTERNISPGEALREAQRSLRTKYAAYGWNHPAFWAPFVVVGE